MHSPVTVTGEANWIGECTLTDCWRCKYETLEPGTLKFQRRPIRGPPHSALCMSRNLASALTFSLFISRSWYAAIAARRIWLSRTFRLPSRSWAISRMSSSLSRSSSPTFKDNCLYSFIFFTSSHLLVCELADKTAPPMVGEGPRVLPAGGLRASTKGLVHHLSFLTIP